MNNKASGGRSGPPPIVYFLLVAIGLGSLWIWREKISALLTSRPAPPDMPGGLGHSMPAEAFPLPSSVPAGTTVSIDGSTSMVLINEALKAGFLATYPGTEVITAAVGSDNGIQALLAKSISLAAISRPLTQEEQELGLAAVPVARDRIALVVGIGNPFRRGLSRNQVVQIFQGTITDWSTLGGPAGTIQVLNRPSVSGTHSAFRTIVLKGEPFGDTPNITTLTRDATTPMLRQLGRDGIGYATHGQVVDQQTVRVVPINGLTPEAEAYPFQRPLFYAYRNPPDPGVRAFLGYALSPNGQVAIESAVSGT
jgi:phosphate transport system substrate-binding protein